MADQTGAPGPAAQPSRARWFPFGGSGAPPEVATTDRLAVQLPERYRLRGDGDKTLICLEAPTLSVVVDRSLSVSAAALKSAEAGSIYLDGAAQAAPRLDVDRGVLNLDHHEGCIRPFTLSTCEQAFLVVSKGFDFEGRQWTVYANEPDLDTVLAVWVLLNHRRIRSASPHVQESLIPLLRLEGIIDTHGFDQISFSGFPESLQKATLALIDRLHEPETTAKADGSWSQLDPLQFTLEQLRRVDEELYQDSDFQGQEEVEELARAELPNRKLAIACQSGAGVYRVEEELSNTYGDRLGILALAKDASTYTLRLVGSFSGLDLGRVYERLNLLDRAAGPSHSSRRWGGSTEIGGSPRGVGTLLTPTAIVTACRDASTPLTPTQLMRTITRSFTGAAAIMLAAMLVGWLPLVSPGVAGWLQAATLVVGAAALWAFRHAGTPGIAGLRPPVGWLWLLTLPTAAIGLLLVGGAPSTTSSSLSDALRMATLGLGLELLFRGFVFSEVLLRIAGHRPRLWLSPGLVSTALYTLAVVALSGSLQPHPLLQQWTPAGLHPLFVVAGGAAVAGASLAWMRQRSESLLPPLVVHPLLAAVLTLFG